MADTKHKGQNRETVTLDRWRRVTTLLRASWLRLVLVREDEGQELATAKLRSL